MQHKFMGLCQNNFIFWQMRNQIPLSVHHMMILKSYELSVKNENCPLDYDRLIIH